MKALILVDIQNDFLPGGALEVPGGDKIIPLVNSLQQQFDLVVATQDWHPQDHQSFASAHHGREAYETIDLFGLKQVLWPDHCVQGSPGAEFSSLLNMNRVQAIFRKGTEPDIDSYSGFFDNGKRKGTGLEGYLKSLNVKEVFVAGLAGDYCVYFTADDALDLGFDVTIIADATRPIDREDFSREMDRFREKGGCVLKALG